MKRLSHPSGFSLIEVTAAVCIIGVAVVALLSLIPMGVANTRTCLAQTRAAELSRTVLSTLAGEPFAASRCFSTTSDSTIDWSTQTAPIYLYASYASKASADPSSNLPTVLIMRWSEGADESDPTKPVTLPPTMAKDLEVFRLVLRNEPQSYSSSDPSIVGGKLQVKVYFGFEKQSVFSTSTYLGSSARAGVIAQSAL